MKYAVVKITIGYFAAQPSAVCHSRLDREIKIEILVVITRDVYVYEKSPNEDSFMCIRVVQKPMKKLKAKYYASLPE